MLAMCILSSYMYIGKLRVFFYAAGSLFCELNPFNPINPCVLFVEQRQAMKTQIRRNIKWRRISLRCLLTECFIRSLIKLKIPHKNPKIDNELVQLIEKGNPCDINCLREYIIESRHEISNKVVCAPIKASDQPAHTRSLIRAFASHLSIL